MSYQDFLESKMVIAPETGFDIGPDDVNKALLPHQRDAVIWAVKGGQLRSVLRDLFGTIPEKQRRQIQNAANDMEVRLVPKLTPRKVSLVLEEETAKELVNAAQARCKYECVPDIDGDRNCELCKLLEAVVPLEKYESATCPYWRAEWEE